MCEPPAAASGAPGSSGCVTQTASRSRSSSSVSVQRSGPSSGQLGGHSAANDSVARFAPGPPRKGTSTTKQPRASITRVYGSRVRSPPSTCGGNGSGRLTGRGVWTRAEAAVADPARRDRGRLRTVPGQPRATRSNGDGWLVPIAWRQGSSAPSRDAVPPVTEGLHSARHPDGAGRDVLAHADEVGARGCRLDLRRPPARGRDRGGRSRREGVRAAAVADRSGAHDPGGRRTSPISRPMRWRSASAVSDTSSRPVPLRSAVDASRATQRWMGV
jgi:hypothetical protein